MSRISARPSATIVPDAMTDDNLDGLIGAIIQYPLAGRLI